MPNLPQLVSKSVPFECVLALWLVNHPDQIVFKDDTYYVYNSSKKYFLYRKPSNKKLNGWYRARGLDSWLTQALRRDDLC